MEGTYTIVFEKLEKALAEEGATDDERIAVIRLQTEAEEIAELRRIVSEITDPQPIFFAGT